MKYINVLLTIFLFGASAAWAFPPTPPQSAMIFGDGDTRFYESADDNLKIMVAGADAWIINQYLQFLSNDDHGAALEGAPTSATNPTIVPDRSYFDTGIGGAGDGTVVVITNGTLSKQFSDTSGVKTEKVSSQTVADDGTITFPTGISGKGWAAAGDNEEYIEFRFSADGTVTLLSDVTVNTANTDADGNLCAYDGGSGIIIKNRLGAEKTIKYQVMY